LQECTIIVIKLSDKSIATMRKNNQKCKRLLMCEVIL
jgi:hypothetical protein